MEASDRVGGRRPLANDSFYIFWRAGAMVAENSLKNSTVNLSGPGVLPFCNDIIASCTFLIEIKLPSSLHKSSSILGKIILSKGLSPFHKSEGHCEE